MFRKWCATSGRARWRCQGDVGASRYINLVVLLRITCEITATVLLVVFLYDNFGLKWGLFGAAAIMVVTSFVVMGWARAPSAVNTPIPSR